MQEPDSILKLYTTIHRKMIMHLRQKIEPYGFSRGEFPFLVRLLRKGDGISQKEVCEDVYISKSTTSKMINKLEEEGYLEMKTDPKDRRVKRIYLTDKKHDVKGIVENIEEDVEEMIFKDFSDEEREIFILYLQRIMNNIEEVVNN